MERFWKSRLFEVLLIVLLSLVIIYMLFKMKPMIMGLYSFLEAVLGPFVFAMIISYVLNPVVNLLYVRKVPRTIAVLLIYAVFILAVTVILLNFIPMFMKQLKDLNEQIPQLTIQAEHIVKGLNTNPMLPDSIRQGINKSIAQLENGISTAISDYINQIGSTINTMFIVFIIPFLAFYMIKDIRLIEKTALTFVPKKHRADITELLVKIDSALGNYVRGQFIVCMIVGVLAYIGYWIIGLPYPLLMASVAALFNIIPYVGPFFGAAPALLMAATVSWKLVLFVIIVNMIIQNLEGNFISPQVVGRSLNLHPLVIIFALLAGGEIAGIIGLILAVPVFAVVKVIIEHVINHYTQHRST